MTSIDSTRIIQGVVPPGGWHVKVDGLKEPIRAETPQALVQALIDYRISMNLKIGDPARDIEDYLCTTFPRFCHQRRGAKVHVQVLAVPGQAVVVPSDGGFHKPSDSIQTLADSVIDWFDRVIDHIDGNSMVVRSVAEARSEVCMKCPNNVRLMTSCSACNDNLRRLSTIASMGQSLVKDRKLKGCSVLQHENRSAVWMSKHLLRKGAEGLKRNQVLSAPHYCWARKEIEKDENFAKRD